MALDLPFRLNAATAAARGALAAAIIFGGTAFAARAETVMADNSPVRSPVKTVPPGECAAFFHYIADEYRAFPNKISKTFLETTLRFKRAGCSAQDKDGPIQIITMTDQDSANLRTSLRLMGKFDIMGVSGVKGCHRPPGGVCTSVQSTPPASSPNTR